MEERAKGVHRTYVYIHKKMLKADDNIENRNTPTHTKLFYFRFLSKKN